MLTFAGDWGLIRPNVRTSHQNLPIFYCCLTNINAHICGRLRFNSPNVRTSRARPCYFLVFSARLCSHQNLPIFYCCLTNINAHISNPWSISPIETDLLEITSSILKIMTAVSVALWMACSTTRTGSKTLASSIFLTPPSSTLIPA